MQQKRPYKRAQRVADVIRQVVSEIFLRKIQHHNLEGVTITDVSITDDLQHAKIFYRVLDISQRGQVERELKSVMPMVRKELGAEMKLRYTPDLRFEYDESFEYGNRIDQLLESVRTGEEE